MISATTTLPGYLAYLRAHALLYVGWLAVLGLVVQAPFAYLRTLLARRRAGTVAPAPSDGETPRYLAWVVGLLTLNVVLALYWETKQDGLMYYYLLLVQFFDLLRRRAGRGGCSADGPVGPPALLVTAWSRRRKPTVENGWSVVWPGWPRSP